MRHLDPFRVAVWAAVLCFCLVVWAAGLALIFWLV